MAATYYCIITLTLPMPTARLFIYEDAKQTSILCLDLKWSSESRYYHTFRRNCCVTTTNIMTGCDLFCYERRFVRLMRQSTSQPFFIDPVYKSPDKCLHGQKQARKKKGSKLAHLAVQKFVQFRWSRSRVTARWNRASFFSCKNLSGNIGPLGSPSWRSFRAKQWLGTAL